MGKLNGLHLNTDVSRNTPYRKRAQSDTKQNNRSEGQITPPINVLIFIIGTETVLTWNLLNRARTQTFPQDFRSSGKYTLDLEFNTPSAFDPKSSLLMSSINIRVVSLLQWISSLVKNG